LLQGTPCSTLEGGGAAEHASCKITAQSFGGNFLLDIFPEKKQSFTRD
jgi:hypothetical protein